MPWRLFDLMESGVDEVFWREYDEYVALSDEMRQPFNIYTYASFRPALALMAGDLAASERHAEELREIGARQPGLDEVDHDDRGAAHDPGRHERAHADHAGGDIDRVAPDVELVALLADHAGHHGA